MELRRGRPSAVARLAGALAERGVGRGDVVMTLIGNRPEWVLAMVACFRIGAVVLPCTEQLRAKDLRLRIDVARPALIIADERNRRRARGGRRRTARCALMPDEELFAPQPAPAVRARADEEPCLITFTSGTAGEPKAVVHAQRYLDGQRLQARHWLGRARGRARVVHRRERLVEVGAQRVHRAVAVGRGALLHDARFDPDERLELLERERVNVLCMAPTEYRVIAKRATLRALPAAARDGRRRRGAEPRGAARVARRPRALRSATATARPRPAS